MKKLFLAGFLLFSMNLLSQSFVDTANSWSVLLSFFGGGNTELFVFNGDTMISTHLYQKIYISYDSLKNLSYEGALREQDNKVFYVLPNSTNEGLLYDFDPQIGQSLQFLNRFAFGNEYATASVTVIDTLFISGISRKRILLTDEYQQTETWIEGVGSLSGPLHSCYWQNIVCPSWELLCMHNNNQSIYTNEWYNSCYYSFVDQKEYTDPQSIRLFPNPVTKGSDMILKVEEEIQGIEIYTLDGKIIQRIHTVPEGNLSIQTNGLSPGIYVLRGIRQEAAYTVRFQVVD